MSNCAFCGRPLQKGEGVIPHETTLLLCNPCGHTLLWHCGSCEYKVNCKFDAYDGPEPKTVLQTIQQGNMVAQVQVPNVELQEKICSTCSCGDFVKCHLSAGCDKYTIAESVISRNEERLKKEKENLEYEQNIL